MIDQLNNLFVSCDQALQDALRVIDSGGAQIALVVDEQQKLLGTLTDGDIRRGLLHGASLETSVDQLMNRRFYSVDNSENRETALKTMSQSGIRQIPVLDQKGRVVELLLIDELLKTTQIKNAVVIMAGGKGTRLRPHTENCPKPMILVGNKPMLEIVLEKCIESGFSTFYFSVNYLKEQIIEYFGDGSRWGATIIYLIENEPLGTAGSLKLLPKSIADPFLVLNGDVLTRLDLRHLLNFHKEHKASATLSVRENEVQVPFGVVEVNGVQLAGFQEKPTYRQLVNAGIYVIDPQLLRLLSPNQFTDMPSLLMSSRNAGYSIVVCPVHEYWLDVGRPETLQQAHNEWTFQEDS